MAVLKQTSPTRVPIAPNDSPSKYRPSSRARRVRTSLRTLDCVGGFSNHDRETAVQNYLGGRETAVPWRSINKKTRIERFDPGFKFYPAGAVQVNSPVPF